MHACPCRTRRSSEATYAVVNVAPHDCVGRHASLHMSLGLSGWSDLVVDECRTAHVREATHQRWHVAFHELVERHARVGMSRLTRIRSDMLALACRLSRARRATCQGWNVAPRGDPERHARLGMPLRTRVKRDMDRVAASPDRSSKATFTLLLSRRVRGSGDMPRPHRRRARERRPLLARQPRALVRPAGGRSCPRIQPLSWFTVRWPSASPGRSSVISWAEQARPTRTNRSVKERPIRRLRKRRRARAASYGW
jgi:hypothetical protein